MPTFASQHAFFLPGPTAAGKSELAVALAERVGGEIIGADAFQIYAGLDILSAKPTAELRRRVPHHLVGVIPLTDTFDVAQYVRLAEESIRDTVARGKVPIVCGGTGLYIRALTRGLADLPPSDETVRAELENETLPTLVARLRELDPESRVDTSNRRRVVRALEVCLLTGRPFSSFGSAWSEPCRARGIIVSRQRSTLNARIDARTVEMFENGVIAEVAAAGAIGPTASQMIGLSEIRALAASAVSRDACVAAIQRSTRQYAKRQLTWFRRESAFAWLDLDTARDPLVACVEALNTSIEAR